MVDILKLPLQPSTSFLSNVFNLRCKTPSQQMTGPIFLSNIKQFPTDQPGNSVYAKRWAARCPGDPPRLLDVGQTPYGLHRKIIYQELSRPIPARHDPPVLNKPRPPLFDTKTRNAPTGVNLPSQTPLVGIHAQSTRLFDTLARHITVKAEPLRPSNSLINNSTNTLTTWQRYWASTHAERRRKGNNEPEPVFYRPKQQPSPIPAQTHIIFLRDSPLPYSDSYSNCRTPGSPPSSCNVAKLSSLITPDDPELRRDEQIQYDSHPSEQQVSSSSSSLLPSSLDISSSMVASKLSITIPLNYAEEEDEDDSSEEKPLQEKSLLMSSRSSSHFKSESQLIDEVAGAQQKIQRVTAKAYEFTVPASKKKTKKVSSRQRKRSKSSEKKETNAKSATKSNRHVLINTYSSIKPSTSSKKSNSTTKTTPHSKYSEVKWEEPYVGVRYDPPTPPCSPSVLLWSQDDERDENDTPLEKSQLFPSETKDNDLHSCIF